MHNPPEGKLTEHPRLNSKVPAGSRCYASSKEGIRVGKKKQQINKASYTFPYEVKNFQSQNIKESIKINQGTIDNSSTKQTYYAKT